ARLRSLSRAAIAIPVGGHTADALAFTNARLSPSFPAAKYAAVTARISAMSRYTSLRAIDARSPANWRGSWNGRHAGSARTTMTVPATADPPPRDGRRREQTSGLAGLHVQQLEQLANFQMCHVGMSHVAIDVHGIVVVTTLAST